MTGGLVKQIYKEQFLYEWPGLAQEVGEICTRIGVPNANFNLVTKTELNKALRNHDKTEIIEKFSKYKKLDKIQNNDPTIAKDYMGEKSLADAMLIFRLRTEMVDMKDNMSNRYRGTSKNCETCDLSCC